MNHGTFVVRTILHIYIYNRLLERPRAAARTHSLGRHCAAVHAAHPHPLRRALSQDWRRRRHRLLPARRAHGSALHWVDVRAPVVERRRAGAPARARFVGWARGDSLLIDVHPHLAYWSAPNPVEFTLLAAPLLLSHGAAAYSAVVILAWVIDALCDALAAPAVGGSALIGSVWYKNLGAEWGHFVAPLQRGRPRMCRRFDWWCGSDSAKVTETRRRELFRFALFLVGAWLVL